MTSPTVKIFLANWTFEMKEGHKATVPYQVKDVVTLKIEKELLERDSFTVWKALKNTPVMGTNRLIYNSKTNLPNVKKIDFIKEIGVCNRDYEDIRSDILSPKMEGYNQVDIFEGEPRSDKCPVWTKLFTDELQKPYMKELQSFINQERKTKKIYPAPRDVFNAFRLTHYDEVRVVIIGQDPFHTPNTAHGLAFSSLAKVTPPSLQNIFKEIKTEYPGATFATNDLSCWARQGVLLLNTVLTVEEGKASAHKERGWEKYVEQVLRKLMEKPGIIYVTWGKHAQGIVQYINDEDQIILESAHPSPYSADQGFFGNGHFKKINEFLEDNQIDWSTK